MILQKRQMHNGVSHAVSSMAAAAKVGCFIHKHQLQSKLNIQLMQFVRFE